MTKAKNQSTLAIVYKSLNSLIAFARNARTHSDEKVNQIVAKIINQLKSLFYTRREKKEMTDTVTEVPEVPEMAAAAEFKTGVEDFEKAFEFVDAGVKTLGDAAKDELKALAKKYL